MENQQRPPKDALLSLQDRLRGLLEAVVGFAGDLDLDSVLRRIVRVACELADARYGALGVLGAGRDRRLREFITYGLTPDQHAAIGDLPRGHGILGLIIDSPEPLRLTTLGDHAQSYGFPPNHPPMTTFLGVPIRIRDQVFGNLYLTEKQSGHGFTDDDEEIVIALAAAAGVVIENARLYEEAARRQRWLEGAAEVAAALLGPARRGKALELMAQRAVDAADADLAAVLLRHDDGRLLVDGVAGSVSDNLLSTLVPVAGTVTGAALEGAQLLIDDADGDDCLTTAGLGPPDGWPPMASAVLVPLRAGGLVAGVLLVGWSAGRDAFGEADLPFAVGFAESAALALQVARANEDRGRLAVLEDRDRIGRDLHDLVIQRLFAVGLTLDGASRFPDRAEVDARVGRAVDDIDETIKEIRRTIFELAVPTVSTDLRAELAVAVAAVVPVLGFEPRLTMQGPVDAAVPDALRAHLLAVAREALSNIARHAHATEAVVALDAGDEIALTVTDNGVGMTGSNRRSGLRNLADRAASLGGTFEVHRAAADGGTVVVWRVPTR